MAEIHIQLSSSQQALLRTAQHLSKLKSADGYTRTAQAVRKLTKEAQSVMLRAVQGKRVSWTGGQFTINRIEGRLAGSILGGLRYPLNGDPLQGGIVVKIKHYKYIRDGVRPYDMKPGLLASPRARTSKNGVRYLVVPIRTSPNRFAERVFRIVTSKSKGWIHPGTPPRRLDLYTKETMRARCARVLREAIAADLKGGKR